MLEIFLLAHFCLSILFIEGIISIICLDENFAKQFIKLIALEMLWLPR